MRYALLMIGGLILFAALPALAQQTTPASPPLQTTPGAPATAQALATTAAQERAQRRDAIQATAQAFVPPAEQEIDPTVQTLVEQLPAPVQALDEEQTASVLTTLAERGSVSVSNNALDVIYAVQEDTVNSTLTALLDENGYEPSAVGVDFITEGVIVTLEDATLSAEQTGRVVVFAEFDSDGGRVGQTVIFASINDQPLPAESIERLDDVLRRSLAESLVLLPDVAINYAVTDAFTTDESLVINLSVPFAAAG